MAKTVLGLSAYYHDSAACLLVDGEIVAAAQEERFTRKKHDAEFPKHAAAYCLAAGGIDAKALDHVAFYDKPLLKFERLFETYLEYAPDGFGSFLKSMPVWLTNRLFLEEKIREELGTEAPILFGDHHESHAASAFFPSPFEEAAILTMDGVGEWATSSVGFGKGNGLTLLSELKFPHSIGLLYSAFTYFCGFKVNSGEYKLMGLAPYGEPRYAGEIYDKLLHLKDDGSFRMDLSYFDYCQGLTMTSKKFEAVFGGPPRRPESPLTQREMDMAASVQVVTEEIMMRAVRHLHDRTGMRNLCLAGGVALNCVGNGRILREGPFERIWIQPAAGDAGGALGVALFIWHQLLGNERTVESPDSQRASLLGPHYSNEQIRAFLDERGAQYHYVADEPELIRRVVDLIEQEKVVGLLQGRMEFGPRALGCRSIIGDARSRAMQSVMNLKIKFRESFRPFAPIVLRERVSEYFEMRDEEDSPYMLLVAPVTEAKRLPVGDDGAQGLDKLKLIRSEVPAITHVDYSARVQTVDAERHGRLYKLVKAFEARTGCPVMINTSFNVRGEPIVCSPQDAYLCFMRTEMDVLVLEDCILTKESQPPLRDDVDWRSQYGLD